MAKRKTTKAVDKERRAALEARSISYGVAEAEREAWIDEQIAYQDAQKAAQKES